MMPLLCLHSSVHSMPAWTKSESAALEAAVEKYGKNWDKVAAALDRKTAEQCKSRWQEVGPVTKSATPVSGSAKSAGGSALNPRTTAFEWGGPYAAPLIMLGLPFGVVAINLACSEYSCDLASIPALWDIAQLEWTAVKASLPTVLVAELLWIFFHCAFYLLPIGARVEGMPLRTGERLTYNINAIHAHVLCHLGAFLGHYFGAFDMGVLADNFHAICAGAIIISSIMGVALYIASHRSSKVLCALGGNSGRVLYDMWVGRELNPRIGELDLKFMFELRPGLIGWSLLCWSFVAKAHALGSMTPAIVLVSVFQTWYITDGLFKEEGNLTMMDIVTDGFGFMLSFGDLGWVPTLYVLQAKFLLLYPQWHSNAYLAFCVFLHLFGYAVFRGANSEKDRFRKNPNDPSVAHLKVMKTSAGKSLIVSGYWGICRHPNYVGDWLMTVSWSMLTGTGYLLPYFQPIYFAVLLIHRQLRDEEQMLHKYGKADWEKFCQQVRYRLIPGLY